MRVRTNKREKSVKRVTIIDKKREKDEKDFLTRSLSKKLTNQ